MDFSLTEEQINFKKTVVKFALRELNNNVNELDERGEFSWEGWKRKVNVEFEAVKTNDEAHNEYEETVRIEKEGWIKATARVIDDSDSYFMPSIYKIELDKVLDGPKAKNVERIISFMEEFRMQCKEDDEIIVEGNLEKERYPFS